jgi:hypothetical protein
MHQIAANQRAHQIGKARIYHEQRTNGLYHKHMTIVNDDSSVVNKLYDIDLLTDDARGVIYVCRMFIIQATEHTENVLIPRYKKILVHQNHLQRQNYQKLCSGAQDPTLHPPPPPAPLINK